MKRSTKSPVGSYLAKMRKDPEFQKHYREVSLLIDIAIRIAELRQKKGISQAELARRIQSKQAVISRIENGQENLSINKLWHIAEALGAEVKLTIS